MKHPIHKAMAGLAVSQQLIDQLNAPVMQPQEMPQSTPAPQTPPTPPVQASQPAPPQETTATPEQKNTNKFLDVISQMMEEDKVAEEQRLKEVEAKHEQDLEKVKNEVITILRGKKK